MATKLNETAVKTLLAEKREARTTIWDVEASGFGCRWQPPSAKRPNGTITFILSYRTQTGVKRQMGLGRWPELSVPQARALALKALAEVRCGGDPCEKRRAGRVKGVTVTDVIEAYLGDAALRLKESTRRDVERTLRNHVVPVLGRHEVAALKASDLKRLQSEVAAGKTGVDRRTGKSRGRSIVKGGAGAAAKVLRYTSALLGWAKQHGYAESNAGADIRKPQSRTRTRVFSAEDVRRIADALAGIEMEQPNFASQVAAIRLLMLTGLRKQEVLRLKWAEVDWSVGVLRLGETKTGAKVVPLGPAVLAWLQQLPRRHPNWVFPGRGGQGPMSDVRRIWELVRQKAGLAGTGLDAAVIHTFRHSAVTSGIEAGLSGPMLMAIMGHKTPGMLARYSHVKAGADPVRAAAGALAAPVAKALGLGAEVVPLKGASA